MMIYIVMMNCRRKAIRASLQGWLRLIGNFEKVALLPFPEPGDDYPLCLSQVSGIV
jgi:hypothetical protein